MANWLGEDPPGPWQSPHARTMYREPTHAAPAYPTRTFAPSDSISPSAAVFTPNSFTGMSDDVQERHAKMQAMLNKSLGPEHITNRPGGGGTKLSYLEGWRAINIANEVFGYNGWFTDIKYLEADFIDYNPETARYNMGVTAIVRVRLQDGASHEDVGYGKLENAKSKADGLDKCKKEAVTDALKRALRHFGKLLGNCLYDKSYLQTMANMKAPKAKFDFDSIYKPERDNYQHFPPRASTSAASAMPPPALPAQHPPPPRKDMPPPPTHPPHLAQQVQRASTVAASHAPQTPASHAVVQHKPPPHRSATIATPAPDPRDRTGAQTSTEFAFSSEDEKMYAEMPLPDGTGAVASMNGGGTGRVYHEGDSGYGEMEGLADASFASTIPKDENQRPYPAGPVHPPQQHPRKSSSPQQQLNPPPTAPQDAARSAHLEDKRLAALQRLEEKNRKKLAEAQGQANAVAPGAGPTSAGQMLKAAGAIGRSATVGATPAGGAPVPALGNARPPTLRPPQAPSRNSSLQRSTTAATPAHHAAVNGTSAPTPRVAGSLPQLNVGAGIVKAAGGAPGVSGMVSASPPRPVIAVAAGVGEGAHGGFVSARGVKRALGEAGYHGSPPANHPTSAHSYPIDHSRPPLGGLEVDGTSGAVKRHRASG
ncbi:DNA repair protein rad52 [Rhodotorula toruloides]